MIPGLDELFDNVNIRMEPVGITRRGNVRMWEEGSLSIEVFYHALDGSTRRSVGLVHMEAILSPHTHQVVGSKTEVFSWDLR